MIMNHRCHLDWFFLWSVMARKGDLTSWKAMMKTPIKRIPFFGKVISSGNVVGHSYVVG